MYLNIEELQEKIDHLNQKYQNISWQEKDEIISQELMVNIMRLTAFYGKNFFSLQQKDLENYLPNIKYIFCECCHLKTNLFEESYESFLNFVKEKICETSIGIYEPWNAGIRIEGKKESVLKYLNCLKPFDDIVFLSSELLLQEVPTMYLKMSKKV